MPIDIHEFQEAFMNVSKKRNIKFERLLTLVLAILVQKQHMTVEEAREAYLQGTIDGFIHMLTTKYVERTPEGEESILTVIDSIRNSNKSTT